ncbi:MAG: hypothetical protein E7372_00655 [Clostridiales bacterium]|nr:hypothetical protein [Clostridiales bacterium]
MKKGFYIILIFLICLFSFDSTNIVYAETLSDNINDQMQNLDLNKFEEFFNNICNLPDGTTFFGYVNGLLEGKYNLNFNNIFSYLINSIFYSCKEFVPTFVSIIAISLFCNLMQKIKGDFVNESIGEIIIFVCLMSIIMLLTSQIISLWQNTKNIIENIAKLTEIMSPIILTLMVASGGNVSASVYKPVVAFLSNGVVSVFLYAIIPLVGIMLVFNIISSFSNTIKFDKYIGLSSGLIKWIIGLIITIFTIFLSVQGITSATFDGITIKATKYAISNSVPLVGGFIRDGFDLVVAGSVLIKNVIGITGVFALFYMILSPVLQILAFSFLLKLASAIIHPIADKKITCFCEGMSKCVSYLNVAIISVGFMLFITILLITFSANAFI